MKKLIILSILFFCIRSNAQDSSTFKPKNEIGFNTVLLVKQIISNNPGNTLGQLPYAVFYNAYFTDKNALRVGLGVLVSNTKTSITGQANPRTTQSTNLDLRVGGSHNFVQQGRLTLNVFADALLSNGKSRTVNTSTIQSFPNPVQTIKSESSTNYTGFGAQAGVGVKFNLYRHLSIYAEVPIGYMATTIDSKDTTTGSGNPITDKSSVTVNSLNITLPTTLYLVLRF